MKTLQDATILVVIGIEGILCAFPVCAGVWYVDKAALPDGDGTAWSTAFTEIQPAIDAAYADGGGEIWVAEGVYDEQRFLQQGAVVISEGVSVFGGFSGEETRIEERDWTLHETVIDGATSQGDNRAERVVYMGTNSRLDGLIVQGGLRVGVELDHANNAVVSHCLIRDNNNHFALISQGGYNVRIEYCQIRDNKGGGIFGQGALTLFRCQIVNNERRSWLGVSDVAPQVSECLFADHPNGALDVQTFSAPLDLPRIERCVFARNTAHDGAAVSYFQDVDFYYSTASTRYVFRNCLFIGNIVVYRPDDPLGWSGKGGAVFSYTRECADDDKRISSSERALPSSEGEGEGEGAIYGPFCIVLHPPTFVNCTFVGNRASQGGAIYYYYDGYNKQSFARIANCIFWDNGEEPLGGVLPPVSYSIVEGGFPGTGNLNVNPRFREPASGDYHLLPDSPAIDRGRDTSTEEFGGVTDDFLGCPRGYDGDGWPPVFGDGSDYDIGAYEYVPGCTPLLPWQHAADRDSNGQIELSELLRVIQFYQSGAFHCVLLPDLTEDGYDIGPGDQDCAPHSSDYAPQDWRISLRELLRLIQFYNSGGYHPCPDEGTEDGFCPGAG